MTRAIRKHIADFAAILFVALVALGVAGYILSNQRFYLPDWVPVVGSDFVDYNAELQSAQAVVPGQGQTVNIAGVKVGEIGKVELKGGRARVEMKVRRKYTPIYRDASVLLRPKTGLKDMYLEMDPGTAKAGRLAPEGIVPISNTLPDVNPDEVLASLDADTRDYLRILLSAGADALSGDGPAQLRATLRRFAPTARDARAITAALAQRRANVRRSVTNFSRLADALGQRDRQLSRFVDSSNANLEEFAGEQQNLRAGLAQLPSTLSETRDALTASERFAAQLGPALTKLRPGARALAPASRAVRPFMRNTTPVVRDQIRPFARDVRPVVKDLRTAAVDLAVATPRLARTWTVLNSLFNTLAYNPKGQEEGYLFWLAWANHNRLLGYGMQDAHGPIRRAQVFATQCVLQVLGSTLPIQNPTLGAAIKLLNPAPYDGKSCPTALSSGAGAGASASAKAGAGAGAGGNAGKAKRPAKEAAR